MSQTALRMQARDVNVFYGDDHALRGVSLDVPNRHVSALIGPPGCGKTFVARSVAGSASTQVPGLAYFEVAAPDLGSGPEAEQHARRRVDRRRHGHGGPPAAALLLPLERSGSTPANPRHTPAHIPATCNTRHGCRETANPTTQQKNASNKTHVLDHISEQF